MKKDLSKETNIQNLLTHSRELQKQATLAASRAEEIMVKETLAKVDKILSTKRISAYYGITNNFAQEIIGKVLDEIFEDHGEQIKQHNGILIKPPENFKISAHYESPEKQAYQNKILNQGDTLYLQREIPGTAGTLIISLKHSAIDKIYIPG